MKNIHFVKLLALGFGLTCLLTSCNSNQNSNTNSNSITRFYVSGYISAPVSLPGQKIKDIALPHANVFLINPTVSPDPIASTVSDLSGRFKLSSNKSGVHEICVEAKGFPRSCQRNVNMVAPSTALSAVRISRDRVDSKDRATVYGSVSLADGSIPRGFEPMVKVNSFATIELSTQSNGVTYEGYLNNFGEYIIPSVPVGEDFSITTRIDKEEKIFKVKKETNLKPNLDHNINIQLKNIPPKVHLVSASIADKPVQVVALGDTVKLTTSSSDLNGDKLIYRWSFPDGSVLGPTNDPNTQWKVPGKKGSYSARVIVTDDRGGYSHNSITLQVGDQRVIFSGEVVDTQGQPISQAQVDINGRLINTNTQGLFSMSIPVAERYVMNLRKTGVEAPNSKAYGTGSYIYSRAINGGQWIMRKAQLFTVDPTQPVKIKQERDKRDCETPKPRQLVWGDQVGTGIFQWQDGRGYSQSIPQNAKRNPKATSNVIKLLSRINPKLPNLFMNVIDPHKDQDTNIRIPESPPCLNGLSVNIPANSLVDQQTGLAPTGNVQIALSTIALTTPQMPGDFSAVDGNATGLTMESFGAGSVEIGAGSKRYNLKSGATADVIIPVDGTQIAGGASLNNNIPFLYYNETKGIWERDGNAKLINTPDGPAYQREVKHFSNLNADILKTDQSCVAVELDPVAGFSLPLEVEVTLQPSVVNPDVIQVRTLTVETLKSTAIYNLPNASDIALTPIIQGIKADGSSGPVPAGVFIVNSGGPQTSPGNVPTQNPDGSYYSEDSSGNPTGPCASRVTLSILPLPTPAGAAFEFLQGLSFQSSNIDEFNATIGGEIEQGVADYYLHADPRNKRASFNLFISENKFGQALSVADNEVEWDAQFANSGDLGFGRDMHCRRNKANDGEFDVACYVTNYGQPPADFADQVDADNALSNTDPDATVAMEYSRVENPLATNPEFPDNERAVKFFVYGADPDGAPVIKADLDGIGERPVPQLCMVCHGGNLVSLAADPLNPAGAKKGAFSDRADIMAMNANFLPFDLSLYTFPAAKGKAVQETAFKGLNIDIVQEVAVKTGIHGVAINDLINEFYNNGTLAAQAVDPVVTNWDKANPASDTNRFYRDVFAPTCRTCHVSSPFGAPNFTNKNDFHAQFTNVKNRVCSEIIMPHARRTNKIFWTSIDPNMPGFLDLYGQTQLGINAQCGQNYTAGGNVVLSEFSSQIFPILESNCANGGCHAAVGNANFSIGNAADTYASILGATAKDGSSSYIVPNSLANSLIYQRITQSNPGRMPLGGAALNTTDENSDGTNDAAEIQSWINSGAPGP